jgi:hypothetical protein
MLIVFIDHSSLTVIMTYVSVFFITHAILNSSITILENG